MKTKILVIEDNTDIRENIAEMLDLAGYAACTAENGKQGVELAIRENPAVVICDIMMPELDGYGVLHMLRKHKETEFTPFIFLTAKTERSDLRKGMELGADDYITKPFEDVELLNAVEMRLRKTAVLQHAYAGNPSGLSLFLQDVKNAGALRELADRYDVVQLDKKSSVYTQGKRPRFLFCLISGKVKTYKSHEDGKEYITDLFSAGDFMGYTALLADTAYDESATVLEDAEVMQIPRDDFMKVLHTDPAIANKFISIVTKNVREKEDRLVDLAYSSLRKRVAKALVDISEKFELKEKTHRMEVSREDLARFVGTATESLIRVLSEFKSEDLIEIRSGKIVVSRLDRLRNLAY